MPKFKLKPPKIQLGIYQHYKGGKSRVLGAATHSETLQPYVVYKTLYENRTFGKGSLLIRPLKMFNGYVLVKGKRVKRFRYVG
jgi:cyclomaltodextrinase / maltogenic alpha-amylase / neopullulanase